MVGRLRQPAMPLQRLLLAGARRAVFGSAEPALRGELGGRWGVEERLTSGPREGKGREGMVGALASLDSPESDTVLLGTWGCSALQLLFPQIPRFWGLGLLWGRRERSTHCAWGLAGKAFVNMLVLD